MPGPDRTPRTAVEDRAEARPPITSAAVRARLAGARGRELWRSLEELARDPAFEEMLHREFPRQAAAWPEGVSRRRFLQLAGASLALGGLTACTRQPLETIVPYVEQPEHVIPGRPLFFATSMTFGGYAQPLLAESHMGRPTKVEGNPDHPAGSAGTDLFAQASVLTLYDPDRSQVVRHHGRIRGWGAFVSEFRGAIAARQALGGERLRILTGTVTSPSLAAGIETLLRELPAARWHAWEPAHRDAARRGARLAFGRDLAVRHDLARADVVVALDSDFLVSGPGSGQNARAFAARRRPRPGDGSLCRLYAAESSPTATGTMADHRLAARPSEVGTLALALAAELGVAGASRPALDGRLAAWARAAAADLAAHRGRGVVVAGEAADAAVHALAHAVNAALGNAGETVLATEPVEASPGDHTASLAELVRDMAAGEVDSLVILGGNPVYDAPADLAFASAMLQVPRRVHLGLYEDETSELCHWHVPEAHYLESWGDARAADGTASLAQPLIEPLYGGRTALEVVAALSEAGERLAADLVRGHWEAWWRGRGGGAEPAQEEDVQEEEVRVGAEGAGGVRSAGAPAGAGFERAWRRWLHDGHVPGTAAAPVAAPLDPSGVARAVAELAPGAPQADGDLEVAFRPDPTVWDGAFANNGWLQECPKPLTKLTWDNAALVAPALAARLGLDNEQVVAVEVSGRSVAAPLWILPGHPDGCVTLHLGYGRRRTGRVGAGTGFDAYPLRAAATPWRAGGARLRPTSARRRLASTQLHHNLDLEAPEAERRHLVRSATLDEYRRDPAFAHHVGHAPPADLNLYPGFEYTGHAWGLVVDLNACTGCNACVVACQAENNIPVVGREQVAMGREMHWIRIDRYYQGDLDDPAVHHQPVLCMHCEQAPCEVVCPVAATVHSDEGLNDMIYNRCVGTRYCSNNCPYKVRRFNFLLYSDFETPVLDLLRNPDVTVRSRGVMEKCTYCVQRINGARIDAKREGRPIADGEIQTACQQVCPSRAIAFGDLNDPASEVARWRADDRNYGILEELNTRPRTTYLAKVTDPSPALERPSSDASARPHGSES